MLDLGISVHLNTRDLTGGSIWPRRSVLIPKVKPALQGRRAGKAGDRVLASFNVIIASV